MNRVGTDNAHPAAYRAADCSGTTGAKMKTYRVTYCFEHWALRTSEVKASSPESAKKKLRRLYGRKTTDVKVWEVSR
jgi:hypothetical protein